MSNNRIGELDALRGIAAFAVVLFHYTSKYSEAFGTNLTTNLIDFKYGHYGVQLFFMISGFVIFMTINKVKTPFEFVYKRFIRLYPVFWVCIILTTLVTFNFQPGFGRNFMDFIVSFTMIPSLLGFKPIDGAYWSLVPELLFYAMMLGLFMIKKLTKIVFIGFVWLFLIFLNKLNVIPTSINILFNLEYGMLFLSGINFYFIFKNKVVFINHLQILICLLISFIDYNTPLPYFFLFFIILFYLFVYGKLSFIRMPILIYLGKISYALYLIHQFIGYTIQYALINSIGINNGLVILLVPIIVSILLAMLVTELFEKPFLSWANKKYKIKVENLLKA